jgi:uncharacterized membrane protein YqjE
MDVMNEQRRTFSDSVAAAGATPGSAGAGGGERDNRSLGDLLRELSSESGTLVSQEIALAKAELTEKATKLGTDLAWVGAGAMFALLAGMVLVYGVIKLLAWAFTAAGAQEPLASCLAALMVVAALAISGWVLIKKGLDNLKHDNLKPRKTVETLQETKEWMKEKLA